MLCTIGMSTAKPWKWGAAVPGAHARVRPPGRLQGTAQPVRFPSIRTIPRTSCGPTSTPTPAVTATARRSSETRAGVSVVPSARVGRRSGAHARRGRNGRSGHGADRTHCAITPPRGWSPARSPVRWLESEQTTAADAATGPYAQLRSRLGRRARRRRPDPNPARGSSGQRERAALASRPFAVNAFGHPVGGGCAPSPSSARFFRRSLASPRLSTARSRTHRMSARVGMR
jgi:hypothetical protein